MLLFLCIPIAAAAQTASILRVTPSQWQAFNQTVNGRLHTGSPMALPCFLAYNNGTTTIAQTPDLASCTAVQQGKTDGPSIANYFGGYQVPNWGQCVATHQGCTLSAIAPFDPISPLAGTCFQGSVPSFYVDCKDASHVKAGLKFAQTHQLPLIIKNTGHDHRGRSSAPNSFALCSMIASCPDKCQTSSGLALTFGAGYEYGDLYEAVHKRGYMVAGGASRSVGASGGYPQGGGHGALTNNYGLGADNVLQMKVVLPNGTVATANRCQNQDLFFALRGGGGGFGVILETTSRLYKEQPMQMATIAFAHLSLDQGSTFLRVLIDNAENGLLKAGEATLLSGTISTVSVITPRLTLDEAKVSMQPVVDFAQSVGNLSVPLQVNITTLPYGFYDFLQTPTADTVGGFTGLGYALASRLVPRTLFQNEQAKQKLLGVFNQLNANKQPNPAVPFYVPLVPPAAYRLPSSDRPGGPGYASVTPAWRNSLWHIVMPALWDPQDPTASGAGSVSQAFTNAHNAVKPLRDITPSSGAYLNEGDLFEPDPVATFWGKENYDRLLRIKRAIDPSNLLTGYNQIGWDPSDERYSCYPQNLS